MWSAYDKYTSVSILLISVYFLYSMWKFKPIMTILVIMHSLAELWREIEEQEPGGFFFSLLSFFFSFSSHLFWFAINGDHTFSFFLSFFLLSSHLKKKSIFVWIAMIKFCAPRKIFNDLFYMLIYICQSIFFTEVICRYENLNIFGPQRKKRCTVGWLSRNLFSSISFLVRDYKLNLLHNS